MHLDKKHAPKLVFQNKRNCALELKPKNSEVHSLLHKSLFLSHSWILVSMCKCMCLMQLCIVCQHYGYVDKLTVGI